MMVFRQEKETDVSCALLGDVTISVAFPEEPQVALMAALGPRKAV
jgi:hypothetical protein